MSVKFFFVGMLFLSNIAVAGNYTSFQPIERLADLNALGLSSSNGVFIAEDIGCNGPFERTLVLLKDDATVDETFKSDLVRPPNVEQFCWQVVGMQLLKSGQYLQTSRAGTDTFGKTKEYLSRIDGTGKIDRKFGKNGFVHFDKADMSHVVALYEHTDETIYGLSIENNRTRSGGAYTGYIFHLTKDGELDLKFGKAGFAHSYVNFDSNNSRNMYPLEIRVVDNQIVVVQRTHEFEYEISLFKYQMDGSVIAGYEKRSGKVLLKVDSGSSDWPETHCTTSVKLTNDFIYTVLGCSRDNGLIVSRYNFNGELDLNYGKQGKAFHKLEINLKEQVITFAEISDLKNGSIAVTGAVGRSSYVECKLGPCSSSLTTFQLDSSGNIGHWGMSRRNHSQHSLLWPKSFVDNKGRVLLRYDKKDWSRTNSMY